MIRPLLPAALLAAASACAQTTQSEAFEQGKGYRDANAHAAGAITPATAADVPGRDPARQGALEGIYGTPMPAAGEAKMAECAAHVPGQDDYANQECATINYLRRNPAERPRTVISTSEPAIVTGAVVRDAPRAFTADQPGLSGTYSACIDRTTSTPIRHDTERCLIGHAVTEGSCARTLTLTYAWQPYRHQPGAELSHARCPDGTIRGDRLAMPLTVTYREAAVPCANDGHGSGTERLFLQVDCAGVERPHGYDARACNAPPEPAHLDPPRPGTACTTMPRTSEHCFHPDGTYAGQSEVPVFEDHWDDSACAAFDRDRGVIGQ